ncbi:MAG: hypothetical protein H6509_16295 [Bryobacterales bacterium]|nr:hypothetical protein [Bryobacterales bacterium]
MLDVNLGKETSIELAGELRERGIPFVFATGYSDSIMIRQISTTCPSCGSLTAAKTSTTP